MTIRPRRGNGRKRRMKREIGPLPLVMNGGTSDLVRMVQSGEGVRAVQKISNTRTIYSAEYQGNTYHFEYNRKAKSIENLRLEYQKHDGPSSPKSSIPRN